ncbi:PH domain-containing protein [Dermatophilaceae bacterium Sec6.4]|nr:PH domain-containing protein [Actinomycetota bacterium]
MPNSPAQTSERTDTPEVFRQAQALVLGYATISLCALIVLLSLRSDAGIGFLEVMWPLAIALVAWALFVRPSVEITDDAVILRNLVRDVRIPWERIEATQARWNLRVVTEGGAAYGSWAVSKQRPRVAGMHRMGGGLGLGGGGGMGLRSAWRNARDTEIDTDAYRNPVQRPKSAGAVAVLIDERCAGSAAKIGQPTTKRAVDMARGVAITPAWRNIAFFVVAVVLAVTAAVV